METCPLATGKSADCRIDWQRCGGLPCPLELPKLLAEVDDLEWLCEPGRYVVSPKCDGERALLVVQEGCLWLAFRGGRECSWLPSVDVPAGVTPLPDGT